MPRLVRTSPVFRGVSRVPGFTLIEILLAIGLLVAVLSIAGPALYSRIAPRTFDETIERFAGELRLAREDARRTGEIRLIYATRSVRAGGDPAGSIRIESRRTPVEDDAASTGDGPFGGFEGGFPDPASGAGSLSTETIGSSAADPFGGATGGLMDDERPRLLFTLPDDYSLTHTRPAFLVEDEGFGVALDDAALEEIGGIAEPECMMGPGGESFEGIGGLDEEPRSTLLAVCVPDGTVLAARPTWIVDPDERTARLRIDSASGQIWFERVRVDNLDRGLIDEAMEVPGAGMTPDRGMERPEGGRP